MSQVVHGQSKVLKYSSKQFAQRSKIDATPILYPGTVHTYSLLQIWYVSVSCFMYYPLAKILFANTGFQYRARIFSIRPGFINLVLFHLILVLFYLKENSKQRAAKQQAREKTSNTATNTNTTT